MKSVLVLVCSVLVWSSTVSAFNIPSNTNARFGMREVGITQQLQQQEASLSFVGSRIVLSATSEEEEKKEEVMDIETSSPFGEAYKGYTDPDAEANTQIRLSWWGWILAVYPAALLLDDVFHFWPKEGPIAMLKI
uniref:Uncharacterized protein n=1 Tax=Ditylum brightwellii TaxID=49249 RepID=A0A6V2NRS3_9STRA|mmetsp:Transcript_32729/g.43639  ORF Transcript_32729/g.43639 Transcript_32729/m.43639 type:complete len:135 (-) Transcript_32729:19-423(-)